MAHINHRFIEDTVFKTMIEHMPILSLDLVVKNHGKILLGRRVNPPAKGYWFTLGGRVLKNEKIADAIGRIAKEELGINLKTSPKFIGVFEHLYEDSIYEGVSTHYLNLVYEVHLSDLDNLPTQQHNAYRWFTVEEVIQDEEVHRYVKDIFTAQKGTVPDQKGAIE